MSNNRTSVVVVIVNYRTPGLVIECLKSLEPQINELSDVSVAIVDNASADNSATLIADAIAAHGWTGWASLHLSSVNGGFAFGNNFAIRPRLASDAPPEFFWLLNPDTVVRPGALRELIGFMRNNPNAGICGGAIDEGDGTQWPFAFRFPSVLSELERGFNFGPVTRLLNRWTVRRRMAHQAARVDWVCGASMMVRRNVFEKIGLMDDAYFLYFEETDFCLQARRAGIECWYVPQSRIIHIAGQSTGVTAKTAVPKRLPGYWFDSRRRYFIKNHGRIYASLTDIFWISAFLVGRLRCWLQRKHSPVPPHCLQDFIRRSALWNSRIDGRVSL